MCMAKGACVVKGGHACQRAACIAKGDMCGEGGYVWQGACMAGVTCLAGGMCGSRGHAW